MKEKTSIDNSKVQTPDTQAIITPALALQLLKQGNERFVKNRRLERNYARQVAATAKGQYPFAIILSCIDSRVPAEIIFDQGIGDIFSACVAGNIVNDDILGSMEFACQLAGTKLIVVLGHTSCGAVKGACDGARLGHLTQLLDKLKPAVNAVPTAPGEERSSRNMDFVNKVAAKNVELTIENISRQSPVLHDLYTQGKIGIVGAMYDVATGKVDFMIQETEG
ncbi:MAG TPA: carbonic anhydrase [Bacteroidetes bacterium]|nr:carbonic anhydrase [Bacteroidota bacterium]